MKNLLFFVIVFAPVLVSSAPIALRSFKSLACYRENSERRTVPSVESQYPTLKDDYKTRNNAIAKCATLAASEGYNMFAISDGGLCAMSPTAYKTFRYFGPSDLCGKNGKGGLNANQIYGINGWTTVFQMTPIGCFKDDEERAIPSAEGKSELLEEDYRTRSKSYEKCAEYAATNGYHVFAIQERMCMTGPRAHLTYSKYGPAENCNNYVGGPLVNGVFALNGWTPGFWFKRVGCYNDSKNKPALQKADGQYTILKDNYKKRTKPIKKCARIAAKKGFKVFALQDGGMCFTGRNAHLNYKKYGKSKACLKGGKGGPLANQVYRLFKKNPKNMRALNNISLEKKTN
ncbi:uncharacterized protein LOC120334273 isoform X2 [Styela clava]